MRRAACPNPCSPPSLRTDLLLAPRWLTAPPHHIGVCTAIKRLRCASKSFKHRASLGLHSTVEIVLHHTRPKSRVNEQKKAPITFGFQIFIYDIFSKVLAATTQKRALCSAEYLFFIFLTSPAIGKKTVSIWKRLELEMGGGWGAQKFACVTRSVGVIVITQIRTD